MTIVDDLLILKKHGFRLMPYELAETEEQAIDAAENIGYPVALKVVSTEIEHKTDVGGVKTNINNSALLKLAFREIIQNTKKKKVDCIMVQKMARKGVELIVGGKKDPQFGHMIVLGLGGIYVEIFKDISARLCPVKNQDIEEMVAELKSHPLLEGARGKKPINKKALEDLVLKTCKFMKKEDIKELDLNPVVCDPGGCDIVDVRLER